MLLLKLVSPEYWAVIELAAIGRVVVKVAVPPESVAVPIELPLFRNSTVPVGEPTPGLAAATVAVNVTDCAAAGFAFDTLRLVDDADWPIVTTARRGAALKVGIARIDRRDRVVARSASSTW